MIVVDLAHEETNLEEAHELVSESNTRQEREAAYNTYLYLFGLSDEVKDEHLKVLLESELSENAGNGAADTVSEMRENVEKSRVTQSSEPMDRLSSNFKSVMDYVLLGNNKQEAEQAQDDAIWNDDDMSISVSTKRLF